MGQGYVSPECHVTHQEHIRPTWSMLRGYACASPRPQGKASHGLPQGLVCCKLLQLLAIWCHKLDLENLNTKPGLQVT